LNAGLVNTVHLSKPNDLTTKKINTYTLNITGGVDFVVMQRVIVGASYYRDIRPSMMLLQLPSESETYDIKYSIEQITIKLGYIFG
jgi:opacity protein-like surface antigen